MTEPDHLAAARQMSTAELIRWTAGWKPGCYAHLAGQFELARRRERGATLRSWLSIALATLSLLVSLGVALWK